MARSGLTRRTLAGMLWMGYGKAAFAILQLVVLGEWMLEALQSFIRQRRPAVPLAASERRAHS